MSNFITDVFKVTKNGTYRFYYMQTSALISGFNINELHAQALFPVCGRSNVEYRIQSVLLNSSSVDCSHPPVFKAM